MKSALVIGASGGIGSALSQQLRQHSVVITTLSRSVDRFDLTDPDSVSRGLGNLNGPFDMILIATGALEVNGAEPEKTIKSVSAPAMMEQFALNAVGPALVLGHAHKLLPRGRQCVVAVLSARVGSIGDNRLGGWISYRAAKAALNQIVRTSAIELARTHPQSICVALHPGTVRTSFTRKYAGRHPTVAPEEAAKNLLGVIDRLTPAQTGGFFDWKGETVPW
ncbi:SDR family NAD(P)-dependent oxidoreductase [Ruegeria sp. THAF57]|uniref:SDR family NAD(P)-dependent oxidoreductase n=1 Tax=Ruegeria sp. THAF57 TaxID=2744555 RepID=UPI0015DD9623|nr:SDR family NAD(P)-dependent oxidoreductase [Ruegeria sp. THAF57]